MTSTTIECPLCGALDPDEATWKPTDCPLCCGDREIHPPDPAAFATPPGGTYSEYQIEVDHRGLASYTSGGNDNYEQGYPSGSYTYSSPLGRPMDARRAFRLAHGRSHFGINGNRVRCYVNGVLV